MNNLPRQTLCELIAKYGTSLCDEPLRCEGLLRDLCAQHRREVHVLVNALKARVASDLRDSSVSVPIQIILARLTKRLQDEQALSEDVARWAVESWALALGKISEEDVHPTPAESTAAPSAPVPATRDRPAVAARVENASAQSVSAPAPAASAQGSRLPSRSFRRVYAVLALALVTGGGAVWYYVGTAAPKASEGQRIVTKEKKATEEARMAEEKRQPPTDKELFTLKGHSDVVNSVAFSPDGRCIATGSGDNTAKVWDAQSGKELLTLRMGDSVRSVAFSPDGRRIVTGSGDNTAKVWDAHSGKDLLTLKHSVRVFSVAFSADGRRIVTGSGDNTAKVWDAQSGKELLTLSMGDSVYSVAFSPDGTRIVTGSGDKTAKAWDAQSGKELLTLSVGHDVRSVAFSSDGGRIATGGADKIAKVWELTREDD